jgi:hypothetical protein
MIGNRQLELDTSWKPAWGLVAEVIDVAELISWLCTSLNPDTLHKHVLVTAPLLALHLTILGAYDLTAEHGVGILRLLALLWRAATTILAMLGSWFRTAPSAHDHLFVLELMR